MFLISFQVIQKKKKNIIVVIGLSIHATPVEMLEKLAIPEAEWPRAFGELCDLNHIEETISLYVSPGLH